MQKLGLPEANNQSARIAALKGKKYLTQIYQCLIQAKFIPS
jgi:hypothetical protein